MTASPQIEALAENPLWVGDLRTTLGPNDQKDRWVHRRQTDPGRPAGDTSSDRR
jgi:hypothetical protein